LKSIVWIILFNSIKLKVLDYDAATEKDICLY
jgi:hypothetical protein